MNLWAAETLYRGGRPVGVGLAAPASAGASLSLPTGASTADLAKAVQANLSSQTASVQATIQAQTGVDVTDQKTLQGASAAVSLLQNGYDPSSKSDNANLVHVISGGLCLVPGIGPLLGGAVEALYAVGNVIACPVTDAFAAIGFGTRCDAPPCSTSGNWTTASVMKENAGRLPPMPRGSFSSLAVPALASSAAQWGNCKPGPNASAVVDAVVNTWNLTHAGPAVPYLVPAIQEASGHTGSVLLGGAQASVSGTTPSARAGIVPNIFYAFQPVSKAVADGVLTVNGTRVAYQALGASAMAGYGLTPPRIVMVNGGALLPQPAAHALALHLGPRASVAAAAAPAVNGSATTAPPGTVAPSGPAGGAPAATAQTPALPGASGATPTASATPRRTALWVLGALAVGGGVVAAKVAIDRSRKKKAA